ncbi:radical SAM protein [Desulfoferula mesophila]|uniref:Radical SAM core domain-containing protein n=1 Tax=Desulfoferula mesophila TaxID=3058419 RepID=A0AAU9EZ61_9BACT|nr:hypothetical protein FAK_20340 [Desulfoferula mesophilus]
MPSDHIVPKNHMDLIACDHCNLTCRACNHASPVVAKWFADPDTVCKELSVLAKYYRPAYVKVLGGEPLLHPALVEVVKAARASGISPHFKLVTNGTLLHKIDDAVLRAIDSLEISSYPEVSPDEEIFALVREKASEFGVDLSIMQFDVFRHSFSSIGTQDRELVQLIYKTCKLANLWMCTVYREGWLYKCPCGTYIPQLVDENVEVATDRLRLLDSPDFRERLLTLLYSDVPTDACKYCLGTVGQLAQHALISKEQWRQDIRQPTESLLDYDWLERSLAEQDECDDCKIETELEVGAAPGRSWWRRVGEVMGLISPKGPPQSVLRTRPGGAPPRHGRH